MRMGRVGLELGANLAIPVQDLGFITQIGVFLERDRMNIALASFLFAPTLQPVSCFFHSSLYQRPGSVCVLTNPSGRIEPGAEKLSLPRVERDPRA